MERVAAGDPQYAKLIAKLDAQMVQEVGGDPDETERRAVKQLAVRYPVRLPMEAKILMAELLAFGNKARANIIYCLCQLLVYLP